VPSLSRFSASFSSLSAARTRCGFRPATLPPPLLAATTVTPNTSDKDDGQFRFRSGQLADSERRSGLTSSRPAFLTDDRGRDPARIMALTNHPSLTRSRYASRSPSSFHPEWITCRDSIAISAAFRLSYVAANGVPSCRLLETRAGNRAASQREG